MPKSIILFLLIFSMINFKLIFAQDSYSLQFNGGIISPRSSSIGPMGVMQFNYSLNSDIMFYIYSGYSIWDQNKVVLYNDREEYSPQSQLYFYSYNQDNHSLIPVYLGTRVNLHTNDLFTSFLDFEIGYSYLSYYSYENVIETDPESGDILSYYANSDTGEKVQENLFGVGLGAGLTFSTSSVIDVLLEIKLNSNLNENYNGLFSTEGTYTSFLAGVNYNL